MKKEESVRQIVKKFAGNAVAAREIHPICRPIYYCKFGELTIQESYIDCGVVYYSADLILFCPKICRSPRIHCMIMIENDDIHMSEYVRDIYNDHYSAYRRISDVIIGKITRIYGKIAGVREEFYSAWRPLRVDLGKSRQFLGEIADWWVQNSADLPAIFSEVPGSFGDISVNFAH